MVRISGNKLSADSDVIRIVDADGAPVTVVDGAGGNVLVTLTTAGVGVDAVTDATIATSDIATNNVSTAKHGWAPKAPNDTTKFLRGDATWAVPPDVGGGGSGTLSVVEDRKSVV